MKSFEISKDLYWVGVIDWGLRDFHGYSTEKGSTYNAFLLKDEKVTLFDSAKITMKDQFFSRIREVVPLDKIDYIVVNHAEMDHSGALPQIIEAAKPEKVFCSIKCKEALANHFDITGWPIEVVKSGQEISLGRNTVKFIETRMLHWPDSMFSFLKEYGFLISSDAFGEHWATSERFDDQVDKAELFKHAAKYYANILLPYSPLVQKLIASVKSAGLDIKMILPDHGIIWRKGVADIIKAYEDWSVQKSKEKALVVFDTMWHSTEMMAEKVAEGLAEIDVSFQVMDMHVWHRSDIMTELLDARGLLLGTPTLNNNMLPRMADITCYMRGLRPTGKIGAAFGSYGWSGEGVPQLNAALDEMKLNRIDDGVSVKYVPKTEDLVRCRELGLKIGRAIRA